jgi:hypothetical protein
MENRLNTDKKYLPVCYVVNTWDAKTDALTASSSFRHTWKRVGNFDLPATVTVVTAAPGVAREGPPDLAVTTGKQSAKSLKLTGHELLK